MRLLPAALIAGCLFLTGFAWAENTPADDDGQQLLRDYLDGLGTFSADFRQRITDRNLELVEDVSGRVVLKKPGRFRWDYVDPYERVIAADGERVWLYEADLEQVTIRRLDAGLGETPAALLTGSADVLEHFEYRGSRVEAEMQWLRLEPRAATSDFAMIELGFVARQLRQVSLIDRLGQQTRIDFKNVDTASAVPDAFFRFVPPAGVDVIDEDDL
jgi:outer membrane lipoprotein carrier protein